MTCPFCQGPIEQPERGYPAWCPACDRLFHPVDYSWFRIAGMVFTELTVYVHEDES